jgi:phosphoglycolate phosphatase
MSRFKAVVFDYDGTLFDTRPAIVHCIKRAFEASGRSPPPIEAIFRTVGSGLALPDTFLILEEALHHDRAALNERIEVYRTIYHDEGTPLLKPYAGARDVLQELHGGGAKCLIVSNKGVAAIRRSIEECRLGPFVDLILADEPGMPRKPDAALITKYVLPRYSRLQSRQILMVGDTETDILFARASGMACCWVSYGYGEAERCRALGPEHEISTIEELPALVRHR